MGLPPMGQPPEENFYDYFYASMAAVRIKLGLRSILGLCFGSVLRLGLFSGIQNLPFCLATVRPHKHVVKRIANVCLNRVIIARTRGYDNQVSLSA